jgi:Starch binding domain.
MKINFTLDYNTNCSERILLKGTLIHEDKVIKIEQYLDCNSNGLCSASIEIPDNSVLKYHYYLKNEIDGVERREKGCGKTVDIKGNDIDVRDLWQDFCYESPLNSCAFADSVLKQNSEQVKNGVSQTSTNKEVTIKTFIPYLLPSQNLFVCGNIPEFGNWDTEKAMLMLQADGNNRYVTINLENNKHVEYKFVIKSASNTEWESGDNRVLDIDSSSNSLVIQNSLPNFENLKENLLGFPYLYSHLEPKKIMV